MLKKLLFACVVFYSQLGMAELNHAEELRHKPNSNQITADNIMQSNDEKLQEKEVFDYFDDELTKINIEYLSYVNPDAPKKGHLRYGMESTYDTLNHYLSNGIKAFGYYLTTGSLMYRSPENVARYYPYIAETYAIPKDFSYVIFKIRDNATWSNNKPILADDIIFSLNAIKESNNIFVRINYDDIEGAEKIDDRKVKINFKHKNHKNLLITAFSMPIFSAEQYAGIKKSDISTTPVLSSGPYKVAKYSLGQYIAYERIKDHWTENLVSFKGRCNFQTVSVEYYRDNTVLIQALKAGAFDLRLETLSKNWEKDYENVRLGSHRLLKTTIPNTLPTGMSGLVFNTRHYPLNNRMVRKAITYALDFAWINEKLMYGAYVRNDSYFMNSMYSSAGIIPSEDEIKILEPYKEFVPEELFTQQFSLPNNQTPSNPKEIAESLKVAAELLEQNGWQIKNGKLLDKKDQQLKLRILVASKGLVKVLHAFANALEKLGIKVEIIDTEPVNYRTKIYNFDYDLMVDYFPFRNIIGSEQLNYWHSKTADAHGSRNYAGVKNPAIDMLTKKLSNTQDIKELITIAHSLDRMLLFGYYIIPFWHPKDIRFVHWDSIEAPKKSPQYEIDLESWWATDQNNFDKIQNKK